MTFKLGFIKVNSKNFKNMERDQYLPAMEIFILDNGIKIFLKEKGSLKVFHLFINIKVNGKEAENKGWEK
jgi:hypothetical protein